MNLYLVLRQVPVIDGDEQEYVDELVAICTDETSAKLYIDSPNYDIKIIMVRLNAEDSIYVHGESFFYSVVE